MTVKIEKLERVFLFNGVKLPDPSPDFTVEQVRDTYVNTYPELATAAVIAECGTGKTLISLGVAHVHSEGNQFVALAMVPPQLVGKWAREAFRTLPRVRVFLVDGLRTQTTS